MPKIRGCPEKGTPQQQGLTTPAEVIMKQQHKFSLGYYLMVFFSIFLLESIFFSGMAGK
jgi:hypothetical protein